MTNQSKTDFDVVICGGGVAGLILTRQLRLEHPEISVAVLDRLSRPLPEGAFKVGESTVELASYYLGEVLQLADYLKDNHIRKLGLRFFFSADDPALESRPEIGLRRFASVPAYQVDRGLLETDLRGMVAKDGATLIEGAQVVKIDLGEDGAPHRVTYRKDGDAPTTISARWVVDATGRKQTLQRQLGLVRRRETGHSAVWFRVDGELRVDDMVPASNTEWHGRVSEQRWLSTNQLVGDGYWVWIIPLPGNKTSIGIVASEAYHPLETFQTRDRAARWLEQHEPAFADYLKKFEWLDFGAIKNYTHSSSQVFSAERWACIGDAGVFADPMYSPGMDLIGFASTCVSAMVAEDMAGQLTPERANELSRFIISLTELLARTLHVNYHLLGSASAMSGKLLWDFCAGWAFLQPLMFGRYFLNSEHHKKVRAASKDFFFRSLHMNQMFREWADRSRGNVSFDFIDYLAIDGIRDMRRRNLVPGKSLDELIEDQKMNLAFMEDLAQVLFRVAVTDCCPEEAHRLNGKWLNPLRMTLDPDQWEARGLFGADAPPRDLTHLTNQIFEEFNLPAEHEMA